MPGHSLGNVENNFCRQLSFATKPSYEPIAGYLIEEKDESVDQGNFQYLFGGIRIGGCELCDANC